MVGGHSSATDQSGNIDISVGPAKMDGQVRKWITWILTEVVHTGLIMLANPEHGQLGSIMSMQVY